MYNQQQQNYQTSTTQPQYRGMQRQYQPAGQVQSYYQGSGQSMSPNTNFQSTSFQNQGQIGQQTQYANPEQFHGTNYRGDQAGHDSYLRADSVNPSQFGIQGQPQGQLQFQPQPQGQFSQQNQFQSAGFNPSTNQFHTTNYQGNQPGHDNYLRADSTNPSQSQFSNQGFGTQEQFGIQNQMGGQAGIQYQSPESFHAANYQGNQPGHDNSLRADSMQPSNMQQQFGIR